jgi:membrane protease YdiL (CAAX protease family)
MLAMKRINWQLWLGFLLSVLAFLSYPLVFVNWASTRDFPWANLVLFALAALLVFMGIRRAFAPDRRRLSKIVASVVATLSVLIIAMFIFVAFVASRWLPASTAAPQVSQKAPDFSLTDTSNKTVSLTELISQPINGQPPKGALLVFYRGYW